MKMSQDLFERLSNYCKSTGMPKTSVVEIALRNHLDRLDEDKAILKKAREYGTDE